MPAPVINSTSSVLGALQGQPITFQPTASGNPISWEASALPPGMTINANTGAISGAVTSPGVYNVTLRASNGSGASSAVFVFLIEAAALSDGADIDVTFDLITKAVQLAGALPLSPVVGAPLTGAAAGRDSVPTPLFMARLGDDVILRVRILKNGATIALANPTFTLRLYETSEDGVLLTSTTSESVGAGTATRHRVHAKLLGNALRGVVLDEAGAVQTRAKLYGTLAVSYGNAGSFGGSPTLTVTSDAFGLEVTA